MKFHKDKTLPDPSSNAIFVFGSNLAGRHGAGAAHVAMLNFGAKYGIGIGITGRSYGIPTKDEKFRILGLDVIRTHVTTFIDYATTHPEQSFFVTRIGCGLAGYQDAEIAPLFATAPHNCDMPLPWKRWMR